VDFVAIDFETAHEEHHNPCELGITVVKNWEIVDTLSWLIKPPCYPKFYDYFVSLHHITPKIVANERTFDQIWPEIKHYFDMLIVAHFAEFDTDVLEKTLKYYNIQSPKILYGCTVELARSALPTLPNHKLPSVCRSLGIDLNNHHGAGPDSKAAAKIFIQLCQQNRLKDIQDIALFIQQRQGNAFKKDWKKKDVTERQIEFLEDLGYKGEIPETRHAASLLIDELLKERELRRERDAERYKQLQEIKLIFEKVKKTLTCPHCDYKISHSRVKLEADYTCYKCFKISYFDHISKKMITGEQYEQKK